MMALPWRAVTKFDSKACALADRHYSRRKVGSPQFMPPGQTLVLLSSDDASVFGWWRPHPDSGLSSMNGLDGWTCTIFRKESPGLASDMVLAAEEELLSRHDCGPSGLITYVWPKKLDSHGRPGARPGWCFLKAGWKETGMSADGRKVLLQKLVESRTLDERLPLFAAA